MSVAPVSTGESESMSEHAYKLLRDRLIMLDIAPGEPINEGRIATELGVGRTPVREALKRLETDHLIVSYPRRGTFAAIVDIGDLASISEVRVLLEPLAAQKAALNADDDLRSEFARLAEEIARLGEDGDHGALLEYDLAVHRLIYRATGNPHLAETLIRLDNLATRIWCLVLGRLPKIGGHIREHIALLEAIIAGREDEAAELAREHVRHFESTIRAAL
ncbi:GntR family transcriptional regulator [Zhihengliuella salsuginis]|uniref:GntR family transcriptional regulator n=2 Tax=Zhihengliuella salsuginis TaxID=578222 RepID=A0ABQ3GL09_9MICC|nr:GntR family transcriptional regulator [Zhihengliuella salsuginis]